MRYCPNDKCPFIRENGARSTYADHIETCIDCDAPLISGTPTPPPLQPEDEEAPLAEPVVVATFEAPQAALLARSCLEAQGVPVSLEEDCCAAADCAPAADCEHAPAEGEHTAPAGVRLIVPAPYAAEARKLLDEAAAQCDGVDEPPPEAFEEDEPDPACPHCGGTDLGPVRGLFGAMIGSLFGERSRSAEGDLRCGKCGAVLHSEDLR